ncbi:DnaA ATPase domain-containing protein [Elioraea sp.]|uniref:DnaA ATPase domain-containing protein n=1 Tax=Elioraea sp. TaxID=2185103 RepID=UPI0025B8AB8C|nr:DnaA/Hda family protein [Elioraea sp.]
MADDPPAVTQLPLPFAPARSFAAADLVPGSANADARAWLARWPDWPSLRLALWGPEGSGKSHLAAIWRDRVGAVLLEGPSLGQGGPVAMLDALAGQPGAVVEDADRAGDERALLHLMNALAEAGAGLLLTARTPPARWPVALPDLRSRLAATASVAIAAPDEALVEAVLAKLLADRQVEVRPDLVAALALRMPRDFATVHALAAELDAASLAAGQRVTRGIAAVALSRAMAVTGHAAPGPGDAADDNSVEQPAPPSPGQGSVL